MIAVPATKRILALTSLLFLGSVSSVFALPVHPSFNQVVVTSGSSSGSAGGGGVYATLDGDTGDGSADDPFSGDPEAEPEEPVCGSFSYGALIDYGSTEDVDISTFIKRAKPLFRARHDLWVATELEDSDTQSSMHDLIDELLNPDDASLDPGDDNSDVNDPPSDEPEDPPTEICYSIGDLVSGLSDGRCSRAEKRLFREAYPQLKKALSNTGPFVSQSLESKADAAEMRRSLEKLSKKCR